MRRFSDDKHNAWTVLVVVAVDDGLDCFRAGRSSPGGSRIAVVKSSGLPSYNEAVTAFTVASRDEVVEYNMDGKVEKAKQVVLQLIKKQPDLVLAVGPLAASLTVENLKKIPIVFCMVPTFAATQLEGDNVTGISLTLPLKTQLKTLKLMAENVTRVGLVYHEASSGSASRAGAQNRRPARDDVGNPKGEKQRRSRRGAWRIARENRRLVGGSR